MASAAALGSAAIEAHRNGRPSASGGELREEREEREAASSEAGANQKCGSMSRKLYRCRLSEWNAAKIPLEGPQLQQKAFENARAFVTNLDLLFNAIEMACRKRERLSGKSFLDF